MMLILKILLVLFVLGLVALAFLLLARWTVSAAGSWAQSGGSGNLNVIWVHRLFLAMAYDIGTGSFTLTALGRFKLPARAGEETGFDDSLEQAPEEPARPEPGPRIEPTTESNPMDAPLPESEETEDRPEPQPAIEMPAPEEAPVQSEETVSGPPVDESPATESIRVEPDRETQYHRPAPPPVVEDRTVSSDESPVQESGPEKLGWRDKLRRNKVVFFLRKSRWRAKILRWAGRVIGSIFRIISFERFGLRLTSDLDDPVAAGVLHGCVTAISSSLALQRRGGLWIQYDPLFDRDELKIQADIAISTSPAQLLYPVLIAVLSFPYLSTALVWWQMRRTIGRKRKPA